MAAPAACTSSQARDWIRATAAGLTTATATQDPSRVCNLHHSSEQHHILDPLIKARDWTHILVDISQICFHCATTGTPSYTILYSNYIPIKLEIKRKKTIPYTELNLNFSLNKKFEYLPLSINIGSLLLSYVVKCPTQCQAYKSLLERVLMYSKR